MFSEFFNSICRVGIFMICAQTIVHFRPNASYEKYIKLLVSAMILIQILIPVMNLFGESSAADFESRIAWFDEQLQEGIYRAEEEAENAGESVGRMSLEETYDEITEENTVVIGTVEKIEDIKVE